MRSIDRALAAGATAALAIIGLAVAPAASATTPPRPPAVSKVAAYQGGGHVTLTWTNPKSSTFTSVIVRYAKGNTAPAGPARGTGVHLSAPKASSATLSGLAAGTRYSVSIWTAAQRLSNVTSFHFTTRVAAAPPRATVSGTITDTHAHPLAGVQVYAESASSRASASATTDASGSYTLHALPGETFVVFEGGAATGGDSDSTGYVADVVELQLAPSQVRSAVDDQLPDGAAITGHVTDSSGHPLAGVLASAGPLQPYVQTTGADVLLSGFSGTYSSSSAADGSYTIKGVSAGSMQVCLDTTDHAVTGGGPTDADGYVGQCLRHAVATSTAATTTGVDFALTANPGGVVTGKVTDPAGHPVADAFVSLSPSDLATELSGGAGGVTMADGTFRFEVPAGRYQVCADPGGSGSSAAAACRPTSITVTDGQTTSAGVQLQRGAGIAGVLTGPSGTPLSGAAVSIGPADQKEMSEAFVTTDARGRYEASGLDAGAYDICFAGGPPTAAAPGGYGTKCARASYTVRTGSTRLGIDGQVPLGGAVSGKVTDDLGQPVPDFQVGVEAGFDLNFYGEILNADGTYIVYGLPTGDYTVCAGNFDPTTASPAQCRNTTVHVSAGGVHSGINFTLPAGGSITATIEDAHGHPLAGVDVAALAPCNPNVANCDNLPLFGFDRNVSVGATDVTAPDGTVTLRSLAPGTYALCLFGYYAASGPDTSATGYADSCDTTYAVTVTNHATATATRTLGDGGAISGTVTDSHGNPLAGVQVSVTNAATSDYQPGGGFPAGGPLDPSDLAADTYTDSAGHYTIQGVQPGSQTVCMDPTAAIGGTSKAGYLPGCIGGATPDQATPVSVTAGATTTNIALSLASSVAISGRLLNRSGHAINAQPVVFDSHGQNTGNLIVDSAGNYLVDQLPAGTYRMCFYPFGPYHPQCYNGVAWNGMQGPPAAAAKITLAAGTLRSGVNSALVHN